MKECTGLPDFRQALSTQRRSPGGGACFLSRQQSPCHGSYLPATAAVSLARAKSKDTDRLMAMLPFRSLSLSTLEGRKGTYALILKDENPFQPLVLRCPSVKKKLQEKSAVSTSPSAPGKSKSKGQER